MNIEESKYLWLMFNRCVGSTKKQISPTLEQPWGWSWGIVLAYPGWVGAPRRQNSKHGGQSSHVQVCPLTGVYGLGVCSTCFLVCKTVLLGLAFQGCSGISQPTCGKCCIVNTCILESPSELSAHSFDYPQQWQTIFT